MATQTSEAPVAQMRRAGDFTDGIGSNLNAIADQDVVLVAYTVGTRRVFDQRQDASVERPYCEMTIQDLSKDGQPTGHKRLYHAWSAALAEKLSVIPVSSLPVLARFTQVRTANGFSAWVIT